MFSNIQFRFLHGQWFSKFSSFFIEFRTSVTLAFPKGFFSETFLLFCMPWNSLNDIGIICSLKLC